METLATSLGEYGILGIFTGLLVFGLVAIFKMLIGQVEKRLEQTQKDLDTERTARIELQNRFDKYIAEDRVKILEALTKSTDVVEEAIKAISKHS